jgi:hypothetical protein
MRRDAHFCSWVQRQGHFSQLRTGWFDNPEFPRRTARQALYKSPSGQHCERNGFPPLGWEVENSKHLEEEEGTSHGIERVYHEGQRCRKASEGPKRAWVEKPRVPEKVPEPRCPVLLAIIRIMIRDIRWETRSIAPWEGKKHHPTRRRRLGWCMESPCA